MKGLLAGMLLAVILASCATTPPSRFFTLNPVPLADAAGERQDSAPPSITIGPIDLPRFLDRPQIVTRDGANRLLVDEFNRWGGTLEEEIHRVVSDRLGARLGTQRIYRYPSRIVAETDYRVAIEFNSFDGMVGGAVQLDATFSLLDDATAQVREADRVRYRDENASPDYAAYAAALSGLLARLADDIARAVERANKNPPRGDG